LISASPEGSAAHLSDVPTGCGDANDPGIILTAIPERTFRFLDPAGSQRKPRGECNVWTNRPFMNACADAAFKPKRRIEIEYVAVGSHFSGAIRDRSIIRSDRLICYL
jgi:hypothetical protein